MLVLEFKVRSPKPEQCQAIDEAIRTAQFVRNKCLRYWMDNRGVGKYDIYKHNTQLRKEYQFVRDLNSHATQCAVERTWSSISRFFDNCKKQIPGKKGYPKFKKHSRSVEYKVSGWKLSEDRDVNAAINILQRGLSTLGHSGTYAWGVLPSWAVGAFPAV